jgi:rRNA maturation protein Rpf1
MNLFVSTSRKPSAQTRKLARWLARLLGAGTENRGKRSVEEVMRRAAARGFSRVLFIHEAKGNPSELVFRDENEGWLEPSIAVSGVVMPPEGKRARIPKSVSAKALDSEGRKIAALFGAEETDGGGEALLLIASAREIAFEMPEGECVGPTIKVSALAARRKAE